MREMAYFLETHRQWEAISMAGKVTYHKHLIKSGFHVGGATISWKSHCMNLQILYRWEKEIMTNAREPLSTIHVYDEDIPANEKIAIVNNSPVWNLGSLAFLSFVGRFCISSWRLKSPQNFGSWLNSSLILITKMHRVHTVHLRRLKRKAFPCHGIIMCRAEQGFN